MNITFIAKPRRKKTSTELGLDMLAPRESRFEVLYDPEVKGLLLRCDEKPLECLLVDALDGLLVYNDINFPDDPEPVNVTLKGIFPPKYSIEIRKLFELYAKAEGVRFELYEE